MIGVGTAHQWYITSGGQKYDAVDRTGEVIAEWGAWLKAEGHL
ncbi:hypothetical protein [Streptosporangium amethystogenes]|nr:hypothetical protein [Streptosporangium amethystogenes]